MIQENELVRIKATGEKGRWIATYRAHDGKTLLIKTPAGDRHIDLYQGQKPEEFLEPLPK